MHLHILHGTCLLGQRKTFTTKHIERSPQVKSQELSANTRWITEFLDTLTAATASFFACSPASCQSFWQCWSSSWTCCSLARLDLLDSNLVLSDLASVFPDPSPHRRVKVPPAGTTYHQYWRKRPADSFKRTNNGRNFPTRSGKQRTHSRKGSRTKRTQKSALFHKTRAQVFPYVALDKKKKVKPTKACRHRDRDKQHRSLVFCEGVLKPHWIFGVRCIVVSPRLVRWKRRSRPSSHNLFLLRDVAWTMSGPCRGNSNWPCPTSFFVVARFTDASDDAP